MKAGVYLEEAERRPHALPVALCILAGVVFFILVYQMRPGWYAPAGAIGLVFILLYGWRIETIPILLLVYMTLAPNPYIPKRYEFFKVYYYSILAPVALLASFALFYLESGIRSIRENITHRSKEYLPDWIGGTILLLFLWIVFQAIRGLGNGYPWTGVRFEVTQLVVIFGYFVWRTLFRRRGNIALWMLLLVLLEMATAFQYAMMVVSKWQSIFSFLVMRMITRQAHITLAAFPMIIAFFFAADRNWKRALWLLAFLVLVIHVVFTQQRILILCNGVAFAMMFTLFAFRDGINRRGVIIWVTGGLGLLALVTGMVYWALGYFNIDIETLFTRWAELGSLDDRSTMLRVLDFRRAWAWIAHYPILGMGLGSTLLTVPSAMRYFYIDNSYLMAWFKGGLPHLLLLLVAYFGGLLNAWNVYRKAEDKTIQLIGAGLFSAITVVMIAGATNVCMVHYRFGYVWMMLIAAAVYLNEPFRKMRRMAGRDARPPKAMVGEEKAAGR